MEYIAYTDGASIGNPGNAGWAVLFDNGVLISDPLPRTTNNVAELTAIWMAVEHAPADCTHLTIRTDSKLAIGWITQGWQVRHAHISALLNTYFRAKKDRNITVTFEKVKGHSNDERNNIVDRAANRCAKCDPEPRHVSPFED